MPAYVVQRRSKPPRPIGRWIVLVIVAIALYFGFQKMNSRSPQQPTAQGLSSSASELDQGANSSSSELPKSQLGQGSVTQPDTAMGRVLADYLKMYHPDHSAILLVDGATNRILAWGETHSKQYSVDKAVNLVDVHKPIASLTKMITAAAAFEVKHLGANSEVPMKGSYHTLYKGQLVDQAGVPMMSVKEAFGRSANPAFGILGYRVGGAGLRNIAEELGFNRDIPGLIGRATLQIPDTGYRLAEVASGFFEGNQSSPLHMSAIVRAMLYRTPIQLPFNESLSPSLGLPTNRGEWHGKVLSPWTYEQLLPTFEETNIQGTATKNHHKYLKKIYRDRLLVGSKTGSLGNGSPESPRYEWYVGFAVDRKDPKKALIFTLLQVHEKIRSLPATALGTLLINQWADRNITPQ